MKTLDLDKNILVSIIGGYTFHVFLLYSLLYTIIRVLTRNFLCNISSNQIKACVERCFSGNDINSIKIQLSELQLNILALFSRKKQNTCKL